MVFICLERSGKQKKVPSFFYSILYSTKYNLFVDDNNTYCLSMYDLMAFKVKFVIRMDPEWS